MAKTDVAALLAHSDIAKLSESANSWGSSRDDDASNQHIVRIRDFFAPAFHVFEADVDCFTDIGEGFGQRFALRIAAGNERTNHDISDVVFVGFEKDFEIACGH